MESSEGCNLVGTVLKNWYIISEIGSGAFGVICAARDTTTGDLVAIKFERADPTRQILKMEVSALKKLQSGTQTTLLFLTPTDCPHVCRLISWGLVSGWNYMVMGLLGENLSELRKARAGERFSIITALKLGIKIIGIVSEVHRCGYIHRDIKPSNFVVGLYPTTRSEIFLIDFGLARKFTTTTGEIKQERDFTGFRGTARYASLNSHVSKDLGRRDDLWSVFYLLIEFCKGSLPWGHLKNRDEIGEMKSQYFTPESLAKGLPPEFGSFMNYLKTLDYPDEPNYDYLIGLLRTALDMFGGSEKDPFSWDNQPPAPRFLRVVNSHTSSFSSTGSSVGTTVSLMSSNPGNSSYDLVEQPHRTESNGFPDPNRTNVGERKFFTDLRGPVAEHTRQDNRQMKLGEDSSTTISHTDGEESSNAGSVTTTSSNLANSGSLKAESGHQRSMSSSGSSKHSRPQSGVAPSMPAEKRKSGSGHHEFEEMPDNTDTSSSCCGCSLM